jgi:hypothetical protein
MFSIRYLLPIGSAAFLCASAFADTIILKSGEKLEGKVVGETPTELTVEVKISAGITDLTKIAKNTVAKIEKEQLDEVAWQPLKNIKLGANSLPSAQYDVVMRPLQNFVGDFPTSSHKAEAETIIASFAEEKKRVDAGEVRMGQKWLSKAEVEKERYQINATLAYQYMRGQVTAGDLVGALNSFEQIEKNFNGARIYPDAVDTAKSTLAGLKTVVDRAQQTYKLQQAEFETGVTNAVEPQKSELIAARQREIAQGEAAVAAADRAGLKWPPLMLRSEKTISVLAEKIPAETERLAGMEVAKMRESIKVAEAAKKQIADKKVEPAEESLRKAEDLWNTNEIVKQLRPELETLRATASAEPQPEPAAEAGKPATSPDETSASSSDQPVEVQVEGEKPFLLTPGGIITAIVVLALLFAGVTVYKKIRSKASDILE